MAKEVKTWVSEDGRAYDTEIQALKADAEYWKKKHEETIDRREEDRRWESFKPGDMKG